MIFIQKDTIKKMHRIVIHFYVLHHKPHKHKLCNCSDCSEPPYKYLRKIHVIYGSVTNLWISVSVTGAQNSISPVTLQIATEMLTDPARIDPYVLLKY